MWAPQDRTVLRDNGRSLGGLRLCRRWTWACLGLGHARACVRPERPTAACLACRRGPTRPAAMMRVCVAVSGARRLGGARGLRARAGHSLGLARARLNPGRRDPSSARVSALPLCPAGSPKRACLGAEQPWWGPSSPGPEALQLPPGSPGLPPGPPVERLFVLLGQLGARPALRPPLVQAPVGQGGAEGVVPPWVEFNRSGSRTKSGEAVVCPRPAALAASHPGGPAQRGQPRPQPQPLWAARWMTAPLVWRRRKTLACAPGRLRRQPHFCAAGQRGQAWIWRKASG